ncbi:sensor histidine kinase [uncultured Brevundimonas sp.]|uniref:sensor histidine kinase PhyK n=1 Tax=Brevundimonas sp. CEF1 TaxID=3442642 RepID=UPI000FC18615|nr:sensor histidine kinase [uncultured Brevundimonas sp.]
MVRFGRAWGLKLSRPSVQGIRFRMGLAMAVALLPILMLSAAQTQAEFQRQAEDRSIDLQLAAERSAADAKARIDSTVVLLQALAPEASGFYCEPRLTALVSRLDSLSALHRYSATGEPVCASRSSPQEGAASTLSADVRGQDWYQRLRNGEDVVMARAPGAAGSLIIAVRSERPLGAFQGAIAAVIPLTALQPDIHDPALPPGAQSAVTDAQGRVLISTDSAAFVIDSARASTWIQEARQGKAALFEARDSRGRRHVYAGTALAGRDLFVLLSAPTSGLLSWARLNPIGSFLMPLAAWLVAFLAVMLLSERVVIRWLVYLERVAAIYARGRFSVRPVQAEHAPTEIRSLARTLGALGDSITTRDKALLDSLDEKDALMREIHHRVKNNLQIISSLLSMQQRAVADPAARSALGDTRQRITALALIYRTLYQSEDIREADSRTFLTELVGQLIAGEAMRGPLVTSSVEADAIIIDPDRLAPVALWLVEAVSNAQKHAFAGRGGDLQVRFRVTGPTSVLEVQDDGPGMADRDTTGVGRTLMNAFAKQLRGQAEMLEAPGGGSIARLTFATPEAPKPAAASA